MSRLGTREPQDDRADRGVRVDNAGRFLPLEGDPLVTCTCSSFVPISRGGERDDAEPSCLLCGKAPPAAQNVGPTNGTRQDGPLTVHVEKAGDALMVRAIGELSRSTAKTFEAALRPVFSGEASTVVLDFSGVGFIDSMGLRSVLRIANHSLRAGGRLRMSRASAPVQQVLKWGGLQRLLPLVD
jgi:anti-sigma B factor antagonist